MNLVTNKTDLSEHVKTKNMKFRNKKEYYLPKVINKYKQQTNI